MEGGYRKDFICNVRALKVLLPWRVVLDTGCVDILKSVMQYSYLLPILKNRAGSREVILVNDLGLDV